MTEGSVEPGFVERHLRRLALSALVPLAAVACDYMALSFDGSMTLHAQGGRAEITISDDGYPAPGGYRIRTRQAGMADRVVLVPTGGKLEIESTSSEPMELTLLEPLGCRVVGPNPQFVTPTGGQPVRAGFTIECPDASRG